jgi:hypothetical protein
MADYPWLDKSINDWQTVKVDNFEDVIIEDSDLQESVSIPIGDIPKLIRLLQELLE